MIAQLRRSHAVAFVEERRTQDAIGAMRLHDVRKLVVQTSYGVGGTRHRLDLVDRLYLELVLKPQIADTELQDLDVSRSEFDWVLVQPVHLTDEDEASMPFFSPDGETRRMKVVLKDFLG